MQTIKNSFRLIQILFVWLKNIRHPRGIRIRRTLEQLGPVFVKFGQILSTRLDLLPTDISQALTQLQENVPPFPGEQAKQMVEKAYGQPVDQLFKHFSMTPLAAASIAQVHEVTLSNDDVICLKILRPNIVKKIKKDIRLLKQLAWFAKLLSPTLRLLKPTQLVQEFEKIILAECDLKREAANAAQLRRNFDHSPLLYIPKIYWEYTRSNVLAIEKISAIPVNDLEQLKKHKINLKALAERGVEIFFTQVFRDCFFHADMHPGNIFVSKTSPNAPQYCGIDFGIMGTLTPTDQRYLAETFLAFFKRDYRRIAQLQVEYQWAPDGTRLDELESAVRTVCEPMFQKPLGELSFAQTLWTLISVLRTFKIQIKPELLLLAKTLFNVEGLGRQLYPQLDLWETAQPILEQWFKEQYGLSAMLRKLKRQLPMWLEKFPELPKLFEDVLSTMSS